jgi:hypothetical protein
MTVQSYGEKVATPQDRSAARAAAAASRAQAAARQKQERALRELANAERKRQQELRNQRHDLDRLARQAKKVEADLRRAARSGAASVIAGPQAGRIRSSASTGHYVQRNASSVLKDAVSRVDRELRRSMNTQRAIRSQQTQIKREK